jgi:cellulose 1,4-beta-cellobiosidase
MPRTSQLGESPWAGPSNPPRVSAVGQTPPALTRLLNLVVALGLSVAACGGKLPTTKEPPPVTMVSQTTGTNPFKNVDFLRNAEYVAEVESSAKLHPELADTIRKVAKYPTALWLDSIARVPEVTGWLDQAKKQQAATGKPTLTVIVLLDLPNRDCAANASAGELTISENGEERYRKEFIDPIAAQCAAHPDQPVVALVEPDSLANMTTNMSYPKCALSADVYRRSVVYAIQKLHLPNVSVYLDAAHAGWLGWDINRQRMAAVFRKVLQEAGGYDMIRGFVTNVSNYTHLSNRDGAALALTNPCPNELTYVKMLAETLGMYGIKGKGFVIDTSRNGRGGIRKSWGSWCNVKGAGLGERPRADPIPGVDAYFWVKPPGESDGVSDPTQPRYDEMCANRDAAPGAPQAGKWFDSYFVDLVRNANPPL